VEKHIRAKQATGDNIMQLTKDGISVPDRYGYTHTHNI